MKKILVLLLIVPFLIFGQETKKDSKVKAVSIIKKRS